MKHGLWFVLLIALVGCGGKSSPTEPAALYKVGAAGHLTNNNSASTILQAQTLFDGVVVEDTVYGTGAWTAGFSGNIPGVASGQHTFAIRVVRQTVGSAPYQLTGVIQVWNAAGQTVYTANVQSTVQTLAAPGAIEYSFRF